jgi:hypothetical protein
MNGGSTIKNRIRVFFTNRDVVTLNICENATYLNIRSTKKCSDSIILYANGVWAIAVPVFIEQYLRSDASAKFLRQFNHTWTPTEIREIYYIEELDR